MTGSFARLALREMSPMLTMGPAQFDTSIETQVMKATTVTGVSTGSNSITLATPPAFPIARTTAMTTST